MFLIGFLMTGFTSLRNLMIIVLCGIGLAGAVCGCSGKGVRPASAEELSLAVASLDSGCMPRLVCIWLFRKESSLRRTLRPYSCYTFITFE